MSFFGEKAKKRHFLIKESLSRLEKSFLRWYKDKLVLEKGLFLIQKELCFVLKRWRLYFRLKRVGLAEIDVFGLKSVLCC